MDDIRTISIFSIIAHNDHQKICISALSSFHLFIHRFIHPRYCVHVIGFYHPTSISLTWYPLVLCWHQVSIWSLMAAAPPVEAFFQLKENEKRKNIKVWCGTIYFALVLAVLDAVNFAIAIGQLDAPRFLQIPIAIARFSYICIWQTKLYQSCYCQIFLYLHLSGHIVSV